MDTMIMTAFDGVPLWALFIAAVVLILASVEAGIRLGKYRRVHSLEEKDAPLGAMVGAALGLLGFLLAFTFDMAAARFDIRRELIVEEANAIGTTDLRAGLLPEPHRSRVHEILREYVDVRLLGTEPGKLEQALTRSDQLLEALWAEANAAGEKNPQVMTSLFIQSANEVIDIHSKRVAASMNRIPNPIWISLVLVTILSMAVLGYHSGIDNTHSLPAIFALVLIFSGVLWLIADLDRPQEGLLKVSQQSLRDLQYKLKSAPAPQATTK